MLAFLRSLSDLGARPQGSMGASDFTLERMQQLLAALGNPQQRYPSLHVAGTNGKGSVSVLCAAALRAGGLRVGRFTSPHARGALHGIAIDGQVVPPDELEANFDILRSHLVSRSDWTQFEVVTALAFTHFAQAEVQAAVIEVGLGGRLDATNVLTPIVSVITPIDFDHTSILGTSLPLIAAEKAGIIKPGVPVVLAPQPPEVGEILKQVAKGSRSHVIQVGKDFYYELTHFNRNGQDLLVWAAAHPDQKTKLFVPLLGAHQVVNAATAFAALQAAKYHGLAVDEDSIREGFAVARWPGRFEIIQSQPPLIFDAAHSPHAARALRTALDDYFPGSPFVLVLGVSADKDLSGIVEPLRARIRQVIATQSAHARAMPASDLQRRLAALGLEADVEPASAAALRRALATAGEDGLVLVAGSVFLVEDAREYWLLENGDRH
ncbi:MAG: folylpolyglutamate synthase/dihydrofolate synthase family protein [Anaerolineales bacterium]